MIAASSTADVDDALRERGVDLLVADISASDGDAFERISSWHIANGGMRRILVATEHKQAAVVHTLMALPVAGVFDTAEDGIEKFSAACSTVVGGGSYWSPSVRNAIIQCHTPSAAIYRLLTPTEQMVLGVIGDGCDDITAAITLPLKVTAIRSVRESLHRKFAIQHKGQLVERAAHFGFVIRTASGFVRPGLRPLIAAHGHSTPFPGVSVQSVA
jgi:DNA-binding NarL/FixJ family response regulator